MAFSKWFSASVQGLSKGINPSRMVIRAKLQNNPYVRLETVAEIAVAAELGIKIDANRASIDDWLRLPGISIHQGRSLVELAEMGVKFLCLEDIAAALSLPIERVRPFEPVLFFCYYDATSDIAPTQINVNLATSAQLEGIPGIDGEIAIAIVQNRQQQGNYRNLANLQQRLNLSSQLISQLMYYLKF